MGLACFLCQLPMIDYPGIVLRFLTYSEVRQIYLRKEDLAVKRGWFSVEQIVGALKQAEMGCR
jgi:hypothetical protein